MASVLRRRGLRGHYKRYIDDKKSEAQILNKARQLLIKLGDEHLETTQRRLLRTNPKQASFLFNISLSEHLPYFGQLKVCMRTEII
jgi:hypothetical protein